MKVLVIPEDPTHDQYVLKPIVERMVSEVGLIARVEVLKDPHLNGVGQALDPTILAGVIEDNLMIDLFLLMVDRDCNRMGNEAKTQARVAEHAGKLLACLAWQEVEVWAMALHRNALAVNWSQVRAECDPKERYFDPFVKQQGWSGPGAGRKRAMRDLGQNYKGLLTVCDELKEFQARLLSWVQSRGQ